MSHDFSIERKKDEKIAFFFGYAGAFFIRVFIVKNMIIIFQVVMKVKQ